MRERTHRTRAERSDRGEQDDIDTLLTQERRSRRPPIEANLRQLPLVPGIGEMPIRHLADAALSRQLIESVDGKDHVQIHRHTSRIEIRAPMADTLVNFEIGVKTSTKHIS